MTPATRTIKIIGAGMNGLLTAFYLNEKGFRVEIYEQSAEVGGKLQSVPTGFGIVERAANAILADSEVEAVADKIGLELIEDRADTRTRWIYRGQKRRWPLGPGSSLKVLSFLFKRKFKQGAIEPRAGETLASWGERCLGRHATYFLLEPACAGIFGATPQELSASLVYNYFFKSPRKVKGRFKRSVAPVLGMGEFPKKLKSYLAQRGVPFYLNTPVEKRPSDEFVIATDILSAAKLLREWGDSRGERLSQLPMVDLVSVNGSFQETTKPLKGYGILFPRSEGIAPLGVLINTYIFKGRGSGDRGEALSETWIFGGRAPNSILRLSDEELVSSVLSVRETRLGLDGRLVESRVNRWPSVLPLYGVELEKALFDLPISQNGIHLSGNYLGEIGLNRFFHRAKKLSLSIISP